MPSGTSNANLITQSADSALSVQVLNGLKRIRFSGRLVTSISLHARKTQCQPTGILGACLNLVEGDFSNELRTNEDRVCVASDFELQEFLRLPGEHLVGQTFECLSQHHEAAALGVACTEVQIAERAFAAATSPLGGEDHQVERARLLQFQPRLTAPPRRV